MNTKIRSLSFTGLCVALGLVLPSAFHTIPNAGVVFLPMHIPVLLCGLITGWPYGLACGVITPILSHLATGMPPTPVLPGMVVELAVYGLVGSLLMRRLIRRGMAGVYGALIGAMLAGRLAAGVAKALIFNVGAYSLEIWIASSFVTALPGILLQLVAIPAIVLALRRARIIQAQ
jgi:riboflavin transporter FmnP